jgi:hypothetical protein
MLVAEASVLVLMQVKNGIKHTMFLTFDDVLRGVQSVVEGKKTVEQVLAGEN